MYDGENAREFAIAQNNNLKLAALMDADTSRALVIQESLSEVSRYRKTIISREFGDWTTTILKCWRGVLSTLRNDATELVDLDIYIPSFVKLSRCGSSTEYCRFA